MDWMTIIDRFGVGVCVLVFAAITIWRLGRWIGKEVARPLVVVHIDFLKTMARSHERLADSFEGLVEQTATHAESIKQIAEVQREQVALLNRLNEKTCRYEPPKSS